MAIAACPKCKRITPSRHGECVYCAAKLGEQDMHEEPRLLGGKARFRKQADDRLHYLVTPSHEPVQLEPGNLFVMGRDPRAGLVVRASDVSRQHAEVEWDGNEPPRPMLAEVRSRNGTYLNDRMVKAGEPLPMRSGDQVRLGRSFVLRYLHVTERDLERELKSVGADETIVPLEGEDGIPNASAPERGAQTASGTRRLERARTKVDPDMEGDFAQLPGRVLVKQLYSEKRTGVLTVFEGTAVGEIVLVEGRCRRASLGVLRDREALERVATLELGQFRFRGEPAARLEEGPAPADVGPDGFALVGDFMSHPASDVVRDLVQRQATGVLTIFDGLVAGQMVLEQGVCQEVALGTQADREALDGIVRLTQGVYRFRPMGPGATPHREPSSAPDEWTADAHERPTASFLRPSAGGPERQGAPAAPMAPMGPPLPAPHASRTTTRMAPPPPPVRTTTRMAPPLPPVRRRPPPPPKPV